MPAAKQSRRVRMNTNVARTMTPPTRRKAQAPAAVSPPSALLVGALAGLVATAAMTAVMRRLHERLPPKERYPLPPRELTQRILPLRGEQTLRSAALLSHFAYGAGAGAVYGALARWLNPWLGPPYGVAVWAISYLGWVPFARVLRPATSHPLRRNALMIGVHLVWGAITALVFIDLSRAHQTAFAGSDLRDAASAKRRQAGSRPAPVL